MNMTWIYIWTKTGTFENLEIQVFQRLSNRKLVGLIILVLSEVLIDFVYTVRHYVM